MTDQRVGNRGAGRTVRSAGATRRNRQAEARAVDRAISDDDRLDQFRRGLHQSVLPDIPPIPGYHVCWLTTTNPRDSLVMRLQLGYQPIRPDEVPGGRYMSMKTADHGDVVQVNEMIAFKLPLHLYESYMRHNHHDEPLREEGKLATVREVIEEAARGVSRKTRKLKIEAEEGSDELGEEPEVPSFEHTLTTRVAPQA